MWFISAVLVEVVNFFILFYLEVVVVIEPSVIFGVEASNMHFWLLILI